MSHPFGDLLAQYLHHKHGLSQSKLAAGIFQAPSVITDMCKGKRLSGPQARERVVAIINWLQRQDALDTLDDANALLNAAGMSALQAPEAVEATLIAKFYARSPPKPPVPSAHRETHLPPRHNLPAQMTSFIGHEQELSDLHHLFDPGSSRLLTLTGAGGVGKTRLAQRLAVGLLDAFPNGVWFVEFAPLSIPELVPKVVASVLGVHEELGRPMLATLIEHLRSQHLLLILDNCEHLIQPIAHLADALLRNCHTVFILATGREGLAIAGELTWRVHSLETPDPLQQLSLKEVAHSEAVQLFMDRAIRVSPAFTLTEDKATAVRQICTQLDGIPLAIELAAARVGVLSVTDIAARLDDRFRLLTGGNRMSPPRQQTLRRAMDWSYELLNEPERVLFRRLAVFAGGWTLEAAEVVCSDTEIGQDDVLDLLSSLVNKSLVVVVTDAGGVAGFTRYRFLETLRQYALEKLSETAEESCMRERHIDYFIALGEAVAVEWNSPTPNDPANQVKRLDLDLDNVRHALEWAIETGRVDTAIRVIEAFWPTLFVVRAVDLELLRWLERLVVHPAASRNERLGRAYLLLWELYFGQDEIEQARAANEQAREIGLALEDPGILNKSDYQLALLAQEQGDYALARSIYARLQASGEYMGNYWSTIYGFLALYEGNFPLARDYFIQTYERLHTGGVNKYHASGSGRLLGYALAPLGDYAEAAHMLLESIIENRELGDLRAVAACLGAYGVLAVAQTEWLRAARLFGASEALIESLHDFLQYFDRTQIRRNVAVLRAQLDEETLGAEWAAGRAMTLDEAVSYALAV